MVFRNRLVWYKFRTIRYEDIEKKLLNNNRFTPENLAKEKIA